ncbi:MAG: hypothetical protein MJ057_06580 [Sphaerochaetaceae bacterium]|nr:hypothetical protein [Sphaerochaetaceae bacterium]
MQKRKANITELVLNIIIIVSATLSIGSFFFVAADALGAMGVIAFRYFTIDSNILMSIASICAIIWNIKNLKTEVEQPRWLMLLKLAGTTAVTVTFLTVVFFLAPMGALSHGWRGYLGLFYGNSFILHFTNPVLAIICFTILDKQKLEGKHLGFWGLLPTVLYSFAYVPCVIFLKIWPDFYGFTFGGNYAIAPISITVMYLFSYGLGAGLCRLRRGEKT